jgi:cytosolic iron-sulfur protein assembly protein CIAO1
MDYILRPTGVTFAHTHAVWHVTHDPCIRGVVYASSADGSTHVCVRKNVESTSESSWSPPTMLERAHDRAVRCVAVSPCGRMLASASFDGTCAVYVRASPQHAWRRACALEGHESEVKRCAWSPSGSLLATCGRDRTVWVWEAHGEEEFECVAALHGHGGDVKCVTWHPSEDVLVSASYDESVRVWREDEDGDDWSCAQVLGGESGDGGEGHRGTVWRASFEPRRRMDGGAGARCVSCSGDGEFVVWNGSGFCNTELAFGVRFQCGHDQAVLSCDWGANGFIAAGGGDNSVRVYGEGADGVWRQVACIENAHDDDVNHVEWSPHDPMELISSSDDGSVKTWMFAVA